MLCPPQTYDCSGTRAYVIHSIPSPQAAIGNLMLFGKVARQSLVIKSHSVPRQFPTLRVRLAKYSRRTAFAVAGLGVLWFTDKQLNASAIARNLRTLWTVSSVASLAGLRLPSCPRMFFHAEHTAKITWKHMICGY